MSPSVTTVSSPPLPPLVAMTTLLPVITPRRVLVSGSFCVVFKVYSHGSTTECFLLVAEVNTGIIAWFSAQQPMDTAHRQVDFHRARRNTHKWVLCGCPQRLEHKVGVKLLGQVVTLFNLPRNRYTIFLVGYGILHSHQAHGAVLILFPSFYY